jgi:tRNA (cmo5U34)-methyltransferase
MGDTAGDGLNVQNAGWSFTGEVSKKFDEHVTKSVPFYSEGHDLVCQLSDYFIKQDSICYELGCSTGTLIKKLADRNSQKSGVRYVGIDIEPDMTALANKKSGPYSNVQIVADDILQHEFEEADLIVAYYTIQFVRPSERQLLIDKIYSSLKWGGGFLLFEKVRSCDARFQDIMTGMYNEYKLNKGYTPDEIMGKSKSLKGILEPFSTQGNLDMLKRAGFVDLTTVMKYVCFEGFLAIK